jgi:hypothetical protein
MTTICGYLERIAKYFPEERWVQVRAVVPGNVAIRTRVFVDENTHIARGIEEAALSIFERVSSWKSSSARHVLAS